MISKSQIVIVPLDKKGHWSKGDLLKQINFDNSFTIARYDNNIETHLPPFYQSVQLLVLTDDEFSIGDICISKNLKHTYVIDNEDTLSAADSTSCLKIVAAYPSLTGTLPLSKETIQEWIDNGTPRECSVEMIEYEPATYGMEMDYQGNLILEFAEKTLADFVRKDREETDICTIISKFIDGHTNSTQALRELKKMTSSIPTDVEIEEKAHNNYSYGALMPIGSYDRSNYEEKKESYTLGYKQALKDLGYEK